MLSSNKGSNDHIEVMGKKKRLMDRSDFRLLQRKKNKKEW